MTLDDLSHFLDQVAIDLANGSPPPGLAGKLQHTIGQIASRDIARCFHESRSPEGKPWAPLKRPDRGRTKPLVKTGELLDSAIQMGQNIGVEAFSGGIRLEWATDSLVEYAMFQDQGTRVIPARPFVGLSEEALLAVSDVAAEQWGLEFVRGVRAKLEGGAA